MTEKEWMTEEEQAEVSRFFGMLMDEERKYEDVNICKAIAVQCDVCLDDPDEMKDCGWDDEDIKIYIQKKIDLIKRIEEQIDIAKGNIKETFGVEVTTDND